jgi:large subunit ribosomal protein L16
VFLSLLISNKNHLPASMLYPKRTKFRKYFKGRTHRCQVDGTKLSFGKYGIKSCQAGRISYQTIEAARRAISRQFRRSGQIWVRLFADIPITSKPTEVRMGKGKGKPSGWIARVAEGQILFEMDGISVSNAQQAAELAAHKMGLCTKFVHWS